MKSGTPFVFYEGPPTANGKPGIHHVFARTIKDLVCRYQAMQGRRVTRIAGWDTHGLPVEIEVEKALGFSGKAQIEEYGIDRLPFAIVSRDLNAYPEITKQWANVGRLAYNGNYIADYAVPYLDINSNAIKGLVDVTKLTDASCADCYDVNAHDAILARFGVGVGSETFYDISSADGNALVQKYSIKQVPTIILSSNAKEYKTLIGVWADVGSIEADGTYVFRDLNVMGVKFRTLD